MVETNWLKFVKHCKGGGFFYAIYRGFKYFAWRNKCRRQGVDWRKFSQEK
jgi:predicted phosphoadenosine phosphosulfate sulfurtransferase